jgi:hypothetical protein
MRVGLTKDCLPTTIPKKNYEQPRLVELGNVSSLTNYSVSVRTN